MNIARNIASPRTRIKVKRVMRHPQYAHETMDNDVDRSGAAVVEANHDIPSRWRRVCD